MGFLLDDWGEGWAPVRIAGEDAISATPEDAKAAANAIDDALAAWSDERTIYRAVDLATGFAPDEWGCGVALRYSEPRLRSSEVRPQSLAEVA